MKPESIENIVVDEVHGRTYVVMADRILTDGELYLSIRIQFLRGAKRPARGERLVISRKSSTSRTHAPAPQPEASMIDFVELK